MEMAETLYVLSDDANGSAVVHSEPSFHEDAAIEDMKSFLDVVDDVKDKFHVFDVVTGAVIKGILSDVQQETASQIALKDAEIASLNQKLQQLGNGSLSLYEGRDKRHDELYSLRQQLDSISKSLLNSEWGLSGSQHNFEDSENASKQQVKEKSSRNGVAKATSSGDSEEVFGDPKLLDHMDKAALMDHFNKLMNEMKRQHDSVLYQRTEEIFKLKRDILKKDGSNPFHLRYNKELEQTRKKIEEVISNLDVLLLENKRTPVRIKSNAIPGQHDKNNVLDSEIQQLENGASYNEEDHCSVATHSSHLASREAEHELNIIRLESDVEDARIASTFREEIEKIVIKEFISEINIELHGYEIVGEMKQEVCSIIQNEAIAKAMSNIDSLSSKYEQKKSHAEEEFLHKQKIEKLKLTLDSFTEVVSEKEKFISQIGLEAMQTHVESMCRELDLLRDKVAKQDSYLSEKNREFVVLMGRLEQSQQHVQHNDVTLVELNDRLRTISDSLEDLEKQNQALHNVIEEKNREFGVIMGRLEQAQQHVQHNDVTLVELNDRLRTILDSKKDLEKQNQALHNVIEEKERMLTSVVSQDKDMRKFMENVVKSIRDFEIVMMDQQALVANKVQHSESRFCFLKEQCKHLAKEGNLLRKKALRYKEISETRGSNLQEAELEVDLLGDEVEALTDLLAKIYTALDHYSPVLQHYTGVMETLNMIKKHISMAK